MTATATPQTRSRIPNWAVAIIAAAGLAHEILLLRLFAVAGWHHFAYLAISLALLGFGVAGTVLALGERYLRRREADVFAASAIGFALTAPAGWALAQHLPFNALEIYWDPVQPLWLAGQYVLLLPAFFCVATAVCTAFQARPEASARTYGSDLIGAGIGAGMVVALLFQLTPVACLRVVALLGALAVVFVAGRAWTLLAVTVAAAILLTPAEWLAPQPSQFKGLSQQLNAPGASIIDRRTSPLGQLELLKSPQVPVRYAPGMSLASPHAPPEQLALFTDGGAKTVILQPSGEPPRYLNWLTSALPYALRKRPDTLILGAGGGTGIWQAKLHGASRVTAVEVNPQLLGLVRAHGGDVLDGVDTHVAEARAFVRRSDERFGIIQLTLVGGAAATAAGVNSLSETHVYTVGAFQDYLSRLTPSGLLAITRWVQIPPRDAIKAFATAVKALEKRGAAHPGRHLAMIRSWKTATLIAKPSPLSAEEVAAIRAFADRRSFDLVHLPGMESAEANRYNRLAEPRFHRATQALLSESRERFYQRYPFHIQPATDDTPYYFRFFKWRLLPDLFRQRARGGLSQIDAGYPVLVLALIQALVISAVLILLPLGARAGALRRTTVVRGRLLGLCMAVGLGFLFIEIAFIQHFMLILGHPIYAVALVLAGFLVFAGAGSIAAQKLGNSITGPVLGIAVLGGGYLVLLPHIGESLSILAAPLRTAACLGLIAPLAFCMGMPYARALRRLGERDAAVIPWAWGVNGFASVVAAILATLLAVHLGFTAVVIIAIALYLLAAACYRF